MTKFIIVPDNILDHDHTTFSYDWDYKLPYYVKIDEVYLYDENVMPMKGLVYMHINDGRSEKDLVIPIIEGEGSIDSTHVIDFGNLNLNERALTIYFTMKENRTPVSEDNRLPIVINCKDITKPTRNYNPIIVVSTD